ncbi:MAG: YraN family protein [bacterium]|nr:YraN family protein [bacterium]
MPSQKRIFGDVGEEIAVSYLTGKGYKIVERNFLRPYGELDIVASKKGSIIFFEVKTRIEQEGSAFLPEQSVNRKKGHRLRKTSQIYLLEHQYRIDQPWQIDILAITLDKITKKARIRHIPNAVMGVEYR